VVVLAEAKRELILHSLLLHDAHLVRFEPGHIELRLTPSAAAKLPTLLSRRLQEWTGERWVVAVSNQPGEPTLAEQVAATQGELLERAKQHPVVRAALELFPGARVSLTRKPRVPRPAPDEPADELFDREDLDEEP
jgi:DNA polymerase-3 subunit gamma/tau